MKEITIGNFQQLLKRPDWVQEYNYKTLEITPDLDNGEPCHRGWASVESTLAVEGITVKAIEMWQFTIGDSPDCIELSPPETEPMFSIYGAVLIDDWGTFDKRKTSRILAEILPEEFYTIAYTQFEDHPMWDSE